LNSAVYRLRIFFVMTFFQMVFELRARQGTICSNFELDQSATMPHQQ